MHSHDGADDFYIVAGTQEVLTQHPHGLEWQYAHAGDHVRVPPGTMHAHGASHRAKVTAWRGLMMPQLIPGGAC